MGGYNTYLKEMMGGSIWCWREKKRREVKWEDEDEDSSSSMMRFARVCVGSRACKSRLYVLSTSTTMILFSTQCSSLSRI